MTASTAPTGPGGRVALELVSADTDAVVYAAELHAAATVHRARVTIAVSDGALTWSTWDTDPAPWLLEFARAFLRGEWRARNVDDPAPWPRKINRWRPER